MCKRMSWLNPQPLLDAPTERIVWHKRGAMTIRAADAGILYVTTARIVFVPNRLNLKMNRAHRDWAISDIESVGVADRDWTPYTGGFRKRLCLTLRNGERLLFNFPHVAHVAKELQSLVSSTP